MPNKTIIAIVCITILLVTALLTGRDGVLFVGGSNLIAGLAGYSIGRVRKS